ncbi:hypothetical protein F5887DRAFT_1203828 [Amanita rubescens]|nr:hypothetical protein F5887DRAFT_1203828 [Amanita rubescens]
MVRTIKSNAVLDDEKHNSGSLDNPAKNVETIFRLRPPLYQKPKKGSDSTRKPALYDKHLSDALLLRKVVFSPNLPETLGIAAKDALENANLPPSGHGADWISASEVQGNIRGASRNKSHAEPTVGAAYNHNVFNNIVCIASILQFPSSSWDVQFLDLQLSDSAHIDADSNQGKRNNYAIADAILRVDLDQHEPGLPSQILEDMKITANYFKRIIPFEFKSLPSGSYHTMLGILGHTLMDVFPWEGCSSDYCAYEHGPKAGRKPITGDPLGFDAVVSGADLTISDWDGETREAFEGMNDKENAKHTAHGRDMLQQIWAEMVKCDATYSVLHAGNYELLFFRNRQTQTLYISDVIEPHNIGQGTSSGPGYYQIHVGLYISAIRDATNRTRQLKDFGDDRLKLPDTWTRPYDLNVGKFKPAPTSKLPFHDIVCKYMELCLAPAKKGNTIYKSNRPYRRIRSPFQAKEKFFFLETSDDTDSNELIGTLSIGQHTYQSWPVVIKVANGQKDTQQLLKEYRNHVHLSALPEQAVMFQKTYGLFTLRCDDEDESYANVIGKAAHAILLLEYVGKPVKRLKHLTPNQQSSIQKTLKLIHRKRLLYGGLSRRKIFIDLGPGSRLRHKRSGKAGLPWLTDLSQIKRRKKRGERRKERKKLKRLLESDEDAIPPPLYPIEIGPVSFDVEDAKITFDKLTYWMSQEPWLQTARCAIKAEVEDEWLPGTWLVVKFSSKEHVTQFQSEWNQRPLEFSEIYCDDTYFNRESRESSQAYSPAHSPSSGLDSAESSQASSGMVVD